MKTKMIIALIMLSFGNLYSQKITDSLLVVFYNETFKDYFAKQQTWYPLAKEFYILKDSTMPENVITNYTNFKLYLIEKYQAYPLIKKGEMSKLYSAVTNHISMDTIDIVINIWTVYCKREIKKNEGKRRKIENYYFGVHCRGTMGYVPEGRFIYDTELNEWKSIPESDIIDENQRKLFKKFDIQKTD
jgi:hypothetical protein